jgi:hypothetical protein
MQIHNNAKDIVAQAHQEILRNVVIREAIEIENLIYIKVQKNFKSIALKLLNNQLDKIKKFDFRAKIQLYELLLTKLLMTDDNVDNAILLSFITVIPLFSKCKSKEIYFKFHLENRGITVIKDNKIALSTLSSVIKSFVNDGKDITIIVNTSFPDEVSFISLNLSSINKISYIFYLFKD